MEPVAAGIIDDASPEHVVRPLRRKALFSVCQLDAPRVTKALGHSMARSRKAMPRVELYDRFRPRFLHAQDGVRMGALAYINAHRPAGSTRVLTGSGSTGTNGASVEVEAFAWPSLTDVLSTRWREGLYAKGLTTGEIQASLLRMTCQDVVIRRRPDENLGTNG